MENVKLEAKTKGSQFNRQCASILLAFHISKTLKTKTARPRKIILTWRMILNKKPLYGDIFCFSLTSGVSRKKAAAFVPVHARLTVPISVGWELSFFIFIILCSSYCRWNLRLWILCCVSLKPAADFDVLLFCKRLPSCCSLSLLNFDRFR